MSLDSALEPVVDEVTAPFWAAAAEGRLIVQRVTATGALQWPPRGFAAATLRPGVEWVQVSGRARVSTFSVVHRSTHAAPPVPYVLAVVELDEGPSMVTRLVDVEPGAVQIGMAVAVAFEPVGDGVALPVFRPAP